MASKKALERRRKVAGKILHIRNVQSIKRSEIPANDTAEYVPFEQFQELLADAKALAGSILSSKQEPTFWGRLVSGRGK